MSGAGDRPEPGLLASLRALVDSGLELAQVRLALLGNELQEQKTRLAEGLVLSLVGAILLGLAGLLLCAFVVILFWDGWRLQALGLLTLLAAAGGAWALQAGRSRLRGTGEVFQATIEELRQDRETLARSRGDAP